jgi:hypothetical protein
MRRAPGSLRPAPAACSRSKYSCTWTSGTDSAKHRSGGRGVMVAGSLTGGLLEHCMQGGLLYLWVICKPCMSCAVFIGRP